MRGGWGVVVGEEERREVDFFFQGEEGIRDRLVTGVQTCALPILGKTPGREVTQN